MYEALSDLTLFAAAGLAVLLAVRSWRDRGVAESRDGRATALLFVLVAASWLFGHL